MTELKENYCSMRGRLAADTELKTTTNGKLLCEIRLAVAIPHRENCVNFFSVKTWGKWAEIASRLKKGALVRIVGYMTNETYETRSGEKKYWTAIVAEELAALPPMAEEGKAEIPETEKRSEAPMPSIGNADLPF